jgi:REP element-mobilizing transposase RayT
MPRRPRVDVEGALYHVIARGVERRAIFRDDRDRSRFVEGLSAMVGEESVELFAYVLLENHFHLVLRRHQTPLGQFMRRLLTGYTVTFNRRHRRVGHPVSESIQIRPLQGGQLPPAARSLRAPEPRSGSDRDRSCRLPMEQPRGVPAAASRDVVKHG